MERIKIIGELDLKRKQDRRIYEPSGLAPTLRAVNHDVKILVGIIKNMDGYSYDDKTRQDKTRNVWDKNNLCPTITTMQGGGREPMIIEDAKTTRGSDVVSTIRASYYKNGERNIRENIESSKEYEGVVEKRNSYRIRKLTPRECWRLMAFSDEDFDKAEKVVSNTQLYKQAGNSICVCVLMAIFSQMNIKGVKPWNERN